MKKPMTKICEWFVTKNWEGGIDIPENFRELSLQEKLDAIYAAQDVGEPYQQCAALSVEFFEDSSEVKSFYWISGSGRGAIFGLGLRDPVVVLLDAHTSAVEELLAIKEYCSSVGISAPFLSERPELGEISVERITYLLLQVTGQA